MSASLLEDQGKSRLLGDALCMSFSSHAQVFIVFLFFGFFLPQLHVLLLSDRKKIKTVTLSYQTCTFQALSYNDRQSHLQFLNGKKKKKTAKAKNIVIELEIS